MNVIFISIGIIISGGVVWFLYSQKNNKEEDFEISEKNNHKCDCDSCECGAEVSKMSKSLKEVNEQILEKQKRKARIYPVK